MPPGEGDGDALGEVAGDGLPSGLSVADGLAVASAAGLGVTLGEGLGDDFFPFLPPFAVGEGELFGVGVTDASGVAVGEAVGFGELLGRGEALGCGVALGEAFAFGDGEGVAFFFVVVVELFRFFGAGVGSKMLLILSPIDCASARGATKPTAVPYATAVTSNSVMTRALKSRVPAGSPYSGECRHRNSRAGSSR